MLPRFLCFGATLPVPENIDELDVDYITKYRLQLGKARPQDRPLSQHRPGYPGGMAFQLQVSSPVKPG